MNARTTKPAAPLPDVYEPDVFYAVRLARHSAWKGKPLNGGHEHTLKGVVCAAIAGDIAEARPAPDAG